MTLEIPLWPYVYGSPSGKGRLRVKPEDFKVDEGLSFEPSGEGEHVFLLIQKTGTNSAFVAKALAKFAGVRDFDVGYAGLKDRHALTTQWFSVWLPGKKEEPEWRCFQTDEIKILSRTRHARKLKQGIHVGNRFEILVRDWQGDQDRTQMQLDCIKNEGIANYFGEQRFGNNGLNLKKAAAMFDGKKVNRDQRGLYLSSTRSFLFNSILAERVINQTWNKALEGDICMINGSNSCFACDQVDESIKNRVRDNQLHPTAVLWGKGDFDPVGEAWRVEQKILSENQELVHGLEAFGALKSRRACRVVPTDLSWQFEDESVLKLNFSLPAGSYATSLLRELIVQDIPEGGHVIVDGDN